MRFDLPNVGSYLLLLFSWPDFLGAVQFIVNKIEYGRIKGKIVEYNGQKGEVYESVPYARPPIGELRFEFPKEPENWQGIIDTNRIIACPQYFSKNSNYAVEFESEDCLYLKIVVPLDYRGKRFSEKLPIVYWIHGGSYMVGGKYLFQNSGILTNLSSKKIILVIVDYRLGIEGFLTMREHGLAGNFGAEDALLGLKFIKNNAHNFGGDPENIVVSGESVGGSLVGLIAASPKAKGLVSGVMMFSGTSQAKWAVREHFTEINSAIVINYCNCSRTSSIEVKECMKKVPLECFQKGVNEIQAGVHKDGISRMWYEFIRMGFTVTSPIVDHFRRDQALIPLRPEELVRKNARVKLLMSNVAHDRSHATNIIVGSKVSLNFMVDSMVPKGIAGSSALKKALKERYAKEDNQNIFDRSRKLCKLLNDEMVSDGHHEALLYSENGAKVYGILSDVFNQPGGGDDMDLVTQHCLDLALLFDEISFVHNNFSLTEEKMGWTKTYRQKLSQVIAEFVFKGSISGSSPFTKMNRVMTRITNQTSEETDFGIDAYYFWRSLLPTLEQYNVHLPSEIIAPLCRSCDSCTECKDNYKIYFYGSLLLSLTLGTALLVFCVLFFNSTRQSHLLMLDEQPN